MKSLIKFFKKTLEPSNYIKLLTIFSFLYSIIYSPKIKIKGRKNYIIRKATFLKHSYISIHGNSNNIQLLPETYLQNCTINIFGNNNNLIVGEKCKLFDTELWFEDDNNKISIGNNTSINGAHIAVTEFDHKIEIGSNCLFSKEIDIRNGDSHSIIDSGSGKRINYAGDIFIGNKVWLGKFVKILKGSKIGNNCVIGINSLVNNEIQNNSLAVGSPAKVIKTNIVWKRERIYESSITN